MRQIILYHEPEFLLLSVIQRIVELAQLPTSLFGEFVHQALGVSCGFIAIQLNQHGIPIRAVIKWWQSNLHLTSQVADLGIIGDRVDNYACGCLHAIGFHNPIWFAQPPIAIEDVLILSIDCDYLTIQRSRGINKQRAGLHLLQAKPINQANGEATYHCSGQKRLSDPHSHTEKA